MPFAANIRLNKAYLLKESFAQLWSYHREGWARKRMVLSLRVFFKYDRKPNTTLFRAAGGALSQTLGLDERELAAIFTVQTAGEALNHHPSWRK